MHAAAAVMLPLALGAAAAPQDPNAAPALVWTEPGCHMPGSSCRYAYELEPGESIPTRETIEERERLCSERGDGCEWAGRRWEKGEGVPNDPARAARLYALGCAARQSGTGSCDLLGALARRYEAGDGLEADPVRAATLYRLSCPEPIPWWGGSAVGCLGLARLAIRGEVIPRDLPLAWRILSTNCGAHASDEACAWTVLLDVEGGVPSTADRTTGSRRYWLDPAALAAFCREGDGTPQACRALAWQHERGARVALDAKRAVFLWRRACARGDGESCKELRRSSRQGAADAPASGSEALGSACAGGDRDACWHRDAQACLGDVSTPDAGDSAPTTFWTECLGERRACERGDGEACIRLAHTINSAFGDAISPIPGPDRRLLLVERGLALEDAACAGGEASACDALERHLGADLGFVRVRSRPESAAARERVVGLSGRATRLREQACDGGQVDVCVDLGDRYRDGRDVAASPESARRSYRRAISLVQPVCDAGDWEACRRVEDVYVAHLWESRHAGRVWRRLCRAGSERACAEMRRYDQPIDAMPSLRLGWDSALGWRGSAGLLIGSVRSDPGGEWSLPFDGGTGVLIQGALGTNGAKVSVGWGATGHVVPLVLLGFDVKLSVLGEWRARGGDPTTWLGAEADLAFIPELSIGVFRSLEAPRTTRVTFGMSLGL